MTKEVDNHSRVSLQAAEAAAGEACQFIDCGWQNILHAALDPGIALFFGIKVRRIGRQKRRGKLVAVRREEALRGPRAMGLQPVPDDQQPRPEAAVRNSGGGSAPRIGARSPPPVTPAVFACILYADIRESH